ncbi:hypothetical protein P7K49_003117 [Saguinus oedipus]|uniref:NBS-LRR type resistance protein n=1 Tax=Saguinus oedipus TaxID=9490 RepID=A0ABQ9WK74_SAGOE|nr:hypothetical protein P7K49_003117 [Saguinus oedipus]
MSEQYYCTSGHPPSAVSKQYYCTSGHTPSAASEQYYYCTSGHLPSAVSEQYYYCTSGHPPLLPQRLSSTAHPGTLLPPCLSSTTAQICLHHDRSQCYSQGIKHVSITSSNRHFPSSGQLDAGKTTV